MDEKKGLFLCMYYFKDFSDEPSIYDMEKHCDVCFGENDDGIKKVGLINENGKRGVKLIFYHGEREDERVLFVGDTATFCYTYTEITGPSDWEEVDIHIYLKLIEK